MKDDIKSSGSCEIIIDYCDGKREVIVHHNKVLRDGRIALAKTLGNSFGSAFEYFITGISFGNGGTVGGAPRVIDDTRSGLFSAVLTTKAVITSIDSATPTQVTFTSVLTYSELVGEIINEMALKFRSGDYFSMVTFGDITKTIDMQITFNWRISLV